MGKMAAVLCSVALLTACAGGTEGHGAKRPGPKPGEAAAPGGGGPGGPVDVAPGALVDATLFFQVSKPTVPPQPKAASNPWAATAPTLANRCGSCHGVTGARPRLDVDPTVSGDESYLPRGEREQVDGYTISPNMPDNAPHRDWDQSARAAIGSWMDYVNLEVCRSRPLAPVPTTLLAQWTSDSNAAASAVWQTMAKISDDSYSLGLGRLQVGAKVVAHVRALDASSRELFDLVLAPAIVSPRGGVATFDSLLAAGTVGTASEPEIPLASSSGTCR